MLGKEKLSTYYSKETFREHLRSLEGYLGKKKNNRIQDNWGKN